MKLNRVVLFLTLAVWCFSLTRASFLIDPTGGKPLWSDKTAADDEVKVGRSLGFAFSFFGGEPVPAIDVSLNGNLNFSADSDFSNDIVLNPIARISPLWDDLRIVVGSGDAVIEKALAGKYYSVTWRAHEGGQSSTRHAFQAVLFGTAMRINGFDFKKDDIVFAYEEIGGTFAKKTATVGLDPGDFGDVLALPGAILPGGLLRNEEATGLLPLGAGSFVLYRFDDTESSYTVSVYGNRPPRARPDTIYTASRAAMLIDAFANDDDPDGDPRTLTGLGTPGFGTVRLLDNGLFRYVPGPRFSGKDEFTYTISDPSGLTSTARVRIVPFAPNKGTFDGFISDAPTEDSPVPEITPEGSGFLRITLRQDGSFSGRVILGGFSRSLVSAFDPTGNSETTYVRIVDGETQAVKLTLHLDLLNDTQPLTGTITYGESTSLVVAARSLFTADAPAQPAGPYKVLLFPDVDFNGPAGYGYATMRVTKTGGVTLTGKLGNGRVLSNTGSIKPDGTFPFYLHLPGLPGTRAGALWGAVKFDDSDPTSDTAAVVRWFMPDTDTEFGFDAFQAFVGERHAPVAGQRILALADGRGNATIDVNGTQYSLTIDPANLVTVEDRGDEKLAVTIKPADATFSGSFVEESFDLPGTFNKRRFNGMFLKKRNLGGGLFRDAEGLAAPVLIQAFVPDEF